MFKYALFSLVGIFLSSCNLFDNGVNFPDNNEVKSETISFSGRISTDSESWFLSPDLHRNTFDKSKYSQIDSIIFQAGLRTPRGNVDCQGQLYIISEDQEVSGSTLTSVVSYQLNQLSSGDLINSIPNREVSLGVRLRSTQSGVRVYSGETSYLTVYYK